MLWLTSFIPFMKNFKNYNITKEIELYNNINKNSKRKYIGKCKDKKTVSFLNVIKINYIDDYDYYDDYEDDCMCEELWWSELDNIIAKNFMNTEINIVLKIFPKLNRKQAIRLLYQPSNTGFQ